MPSLPSRFAPGMVRSHHVRYIFCCVLAFFYIDAFLFGAAWPAIVGFSLIGLLVTIGLWVSVEHGELSIVCGKDIFFGALASLSVLTLMHLGVGNVVFSASLVGCLGGWLEYRYPGGFFEGAAAPFYCGAFAGMTSNLVLLDPVLIVLAGALTGALWSLFSMSWIGIGGKMGTMSFIGVGSTICLAMPFSRVGPGFKHVPTSFVSIFLILFAAVVSPLVTQWLSYRCQWGVVLGSAVPSAVVGLLIAFLMPFHAIFPVRLAATWMGASFVGMTNKSVHSLPAGSLSLMGLIFGILSLGFEPMLLGIGGDLGATAAVAVLAVLGLRWFYRNLGHGLNRRV